MRLTAEDAKYAEEIRDRKSQGSVLLISKAAYCLPADVLMQEKSPPVI